MLTNEQTNKFINEMLSAVELRREDVPTDVIEKLESTIDSIYEYGYEVGEENGYDRGYDLAKWPD